GVETTEESVSNDNSATSENETSDSEVTEPASSLPTPDPPPVISGESTNNAQIETTPTPQKDNDIRQRISGIFSEIEGLQAV
ncbi:hypothetical protein R0K04_28280, partial [Pseudoalteromonas sp. SIMBA_153]